MEFRRVLYRSHAPEDHDVVVAPHRESDSGVVHLLVEAWDGPALVGDGAHPTLAVGHPGGRGARCVPVGAHRFEVAEATLCEARGVAGRRRVVLALPRDGAGGFLVGAGLGRFTARAPGAY